MFRARTIGQYCIRKWLEANFYAGSLSVTAVDNDAVLIRDEAGDTAIVRYDNGAGYVTDETPAAGTAGESR